MTNDPSTTYRFLEPILSPPGTVVEFRVIRGRYKSGGLILPSDFQTVLSGWYERAQDLIVDTGRLAGVSGYICPNPCDPALLARSDHKLISTKDATKAENILALRWMLIDLDPSPRITGISATDAERSLVLKKRDAILAAYPGMAECSLTGSSGNGAYVLVRLDDLTNNDKHKELISKALKILAAQHDGDGAEIDQKPKDPSRIMALGGTMKCKGSNREDRPHRLVTLDAVPVEGRTFDLSAFVAEHASSLPAEPKKAKATVRTTLPAVATELDLDDLAGYSQQMKKYLRAASYLDKLQPAISGQNGHDQTFDAACALVIDWDMTPSEAKPLLAKWNQRCVPPWEDHELEHKLADADARGGPRGRLLNTTRDESPGIEIILADAPVTVPSPVGEQTGELAEPPKQDEDITGREDNPHRIARSFLAKNHGHPDGHTIRFWETEFHEWINGAYVPIPDKQLKADLSAMMDQEFSLIYSYQLALATKMAKEGENVHPPKLIKVTTGLTSDVTSAISGLVRFKKRIEKQPDWVDDNPGNWPVEEVLPMRNAIVHIPSFIAGKPATIPPTPRLFCPYALKYDWKPDAPKPARFLEFVNETFAGDEESINLLQEWFGLQLVPVTKYQKMMAFIGPPRAGKGVISSIMREMVGRENSCAPTLGSLAETFGMQSMIGKLSAIIDDARLSAKSDTATIMERLLSISGEGALDVRRMHRMQWNGVLTCRVTMISNELPRLNDNSNAFASRFVILKFTKSHVGHEDNSLKDKFTAELPGILLWSIAGLKRLTERGHFVQPKASTEIHDEMKEMSSPTMCFVQDCCRVDDQESVEKAAIYAAWRQWCEENGRKEVGELNVFARNLRSVVPSVKATQPREGGRRVHTYKGIGLIPPESLYVQDTSGLSSEIDWTNLP